MSYSSCWTEYFASNITNEFSRPTVLMECGLGPMDTAFVIGLIIGLLVVAFATRKKEADLKGKEAD